MLEKIDTSLPCSNFESLIQTIKESSDDEVYMAGLKCQVKGCIPAIRSSFSELNIWQKAQSVLDGGCGPGFFFEQLNDLFKGKKYIGIDNNDNFISVARGKFKNSPMVKFEVDTLETFITEQVDIVLLSAILQHVDSVELTLNHLSAYTNMGFIVLDVVPDKNTFVSTPPLPILSNSFETLNRMSKEKGRNIDCLSEAKTWAIKKGWKITHEQPFEPASKTTEERINFFYYSCFASELFNRMYNVPVNLENLIPELEEWRRSPDAFSTNRGGQLLVLEKQ